MALSTKVRMSVSALVRTVPDGDVTAPSGS
ncbi:Uncharacterised protein [Mycobacterium tuberculosis]|uniref:Uncharacterized protein n=1 Tax=Mycobacterium tuberculosis TaxID=1773 RepID=A0A916LEW5_MYCTX|nr:Uncharacterised protein [Mycobacterium tuberculosis]